jgi:hypothetical protein
MGFLNQGEEWQHVTISQAKDYLHQFKIYNAETGARWHRYVDSEHVKGIAERGFGNYWFFRSIFRSVVQYTRFEMLTGYHWWYGYLFEFDEAANDFKLLASSNTLSDSEYRQAYRACGGCSNF